MRIDRRRQGGCSARAKKAKLGGLAQGGRPIPHFDFFHDNLLWDEEIPIAQRMLQSSCNSRGVNERLLAKAMRLGASFSKPCDLQGGLAQHFLARHGSSPWAAEVAAARGADMLACDSSGRGFAHYAFDARNIEMARWIHRRHPEECLREDAGGASPVELALGEGSNPWREPEEREAFLEWALRAIAGSAEIVAERGFAAALRERDHCENLTRELAWMERRGAIPPPIDAMAKAISQAKEWCRDDIKQSLLPYMARQERAEIEKISMAPPSLSAPARRGL